MAIFNYNFLTVVAPDLTAGATTATSISLSWTSAGSEGVSYEVMWQRDTTGECSDEDEDSATITDGSASYDITGLEEGSSYSITVRASNTADNRYSNTVTAMTLTTGDTTNVVDILCCLNSMCSSIRSSHFNHCRECIYKHHCPVETSEVQ